jgi:hypothetical protein
MKDRDKLGWELLETLEKDREWRRANPREFLTQIADDLWKTMPDDEALVVYRLQLAAAPWWGLDVVECLERVLAERPAWAVPALIEGSQRGPWLGDEDNPEPYFAWLAEQTAQMRAAAEAAKHGQRD